MGDRNSYSVSSENGISRIQSRGQQINTISIARYDSHNLFEKKYGNNISKKLANLMESGKIAEAIFLLNLSKCPPEDIYNKAGFDQNESRDQTGKWNKDNGASDSSSQNVAYQGEYHDLLLSDILSSISLVGSTFIKETTLISLSGPFTARADAIIKPKDADPYIFELKTGSYSMPTANQLGVYRAACAGPHVLSFDPKVSLVGLTPGQPMPKMNVWFAYTEGPGKTVYFFNWCDLIGAGK